MPALENLRVPCWIASSETTNSPSELHVFCDASMEGYGVAAYRRCTNGGGLSHVAYMFGRARVMPLDSSKLSHHNSMPRLELTAARLAAEVCQMLVEEVGETFNRIVMWSDSECVLKQIQDRKTRFKTFFSNRLSKIHEITDMAEWRYVPTDLNPADDCSRGLVPGDEKWCRFYLGPDFLWKSEEHWPQTQLSKAPLPAEVFAFFVDPRPGPASIFATNANEYQSPEPMWALCLASKIEHWSVKLRRITYFKKAVVAFLRWWKDK